MSALTRVKAMLRRLSPPWPSTAVDKSVGKELNSLAVGLSLAADQVDTTLEESFPNTADRLLDRWEGLARTSNKKGGTDLDSRRERVLAVLRRTSGPRIDQLGAMLLLPFDLDINDIIFIEQTRFLVEDDLTEINATTYAITASPTTITMGEPYPGVVDDTGVRLYVELTALGTPTVTLTSPSGTVWAVPVTAAEGWYETRTAFLGQKAGGDWEVTVANASSVNLTELRLFVSNDVDTAQIYNFYAYRDPSLAGSPDIAEAGRLFARTAHGHLSAHVIENLAFTVDDPYSLCDRDPIGV